MKQVDREAKTRGLLHGALGHLCIVLSGAPRIEDIEAFVMRAEKFIAETKGEFKKFEHHKNHWIKIATGVFGNNIMRKMISLEKGEDVGDAIMKFIDEELKENKKR